MRQERHRLNASSNMPECGSHSMNYHSTAGLLNYIYVPCFYLGGDGPVSFFPSMPQSRHIASTALVFDLREACAKPRPLGKVRGHGHCIYKLRLCAEKTEKAATARPWTRPANGACGWPGRTTGLANAPIRLRNKRRPAKESLAKLRWPDGGKGR